MLIAHSSGEPVFSEINAPEPDLFDFPRVLDVAGRKVDVLLSVDSPRVVLLGGFLSDRECDALITSARSRLNPSTVLHSESGVQCEDEWRTSEGMFFGRGETALIQEIENRISLAVNWPIANGEGVQVLRYGVGAQYKPHYDYFDPNLPGSAETLKRGGQRVATVIIYLNDVEAGGGTSFPNAGIVIAPKKGHALFFSYPDSETYRNSLHSGMPVVSGEKYIAVKWLRQGVFV